MSARNSHRQPPVVRPLLPAAVSPENSVASSSSAVAPLSRARVPSRRHNVDTACNRCRKRKTRCNGAKPACSGCILHRVDCVYSAETKITNREATENREKLNLHEELFRILQSRDKATVDEVVQNIRDGQDLESTLQYLKDGDLRMQLAVTPETWTRYTLPFQKDMPPFLQQPGNPYLQSDLYLGIEDALSSPGQAVEGSKVDWRTTYRVPYHAAKLVEERIDLANVSKWTQVTDNPDLLRELLRVYFLYDYPMFAFFHKDLFLDDLVAGKGEHCSSLLVNTVLASACHAYSKATFRTEFWNPRSLQYRFSAEARRLQELEAGKNSITYVQAAAIMSTCCMMDGTDRVGWSYVLQSLAVSEELQPFRHSSDTTNNRMKVAKMFTSWALFMWQSQLCFHYLRAPLLMQPPPFLLPSPLSSQVSWYPEVWVQYPTNNGPIPLRFGESFKAQTELRLLLNDIALVAFPRGEKPKTLSLKQTHTFYSQLEQWYTHLPPSMSVKRAVLPHQLIHHMQYFNVIMILFKPAISDDTINNKIASPSPEAIVHDARVRLETLFRLYYLRHGFEFWNSLLLHFEVLLGYSAVETLLTGDSLTDEAADAARSTVALALKGLYEQGRHSHLGLTLYRLLRLQMRGKHSRVLRDLVEVADDDDEVVARREVHVESQYPVNIVSIAEDPEKHEMSNLANAYKELVLQDSAGEPMAEQRGEESSLGEE